MMITLTGIVAACGGCKGTISDDLQSVTRLDCDRKNQYEIVISHINKVAENHRIPVITRISNAHSGSFMSSLNNGAGQVAVVTYHTSQIQIIFQPNLFLTGLRDEKRSLRQVFESVKSELRTVCRESLEDVNISSPNYSDGVDGALELR